LVYRYFDDKADIFDRLVERVLGELAKCLEIGTARAPQDYEAQLRGGLDAILAWVAAEPASAWVCFVESLCGTRTSMRLYLESIERLTRLFASTMSSGVLRPALTDELFVGGLAWRLGALLRDGEAARAPELAPGLHSLLLAHLSVGPIAPTRSSAPPAQTARHGTVVEALQGI
jgi:AcrR family transcriptional regulator